MFQNGNYSIRNFSIYGCSVLNEMRGLFYRNIMLGWFCCKQKFALLRSLFICVRGFRSSACHRANDSINLYIAERRRKQALCCKVVLFISIFMLMPLGTFRVKISMSSLCYSHTCTFFFFV